MQFEVLSIQMCGCATRFIANCKPKENSFSLVQDVTGFMVGSKSEQGE
jgi:acetyl-CoA carboxylase carboxyltransferase component